MGQPFCSFPAQTSTWMAISIARGLSGKPLATFPEKEWGWVPPRKYAFDKYLNIPRDQFSGDWFSHACHICISFVVNQSPSLMQILTLKSNQASQ
jgi:hypothetical protein